MLSGKPIRLPFGVVRDKDKQNYIKLNLPPDYRMFLLEQLPYLVQLGNPAIADIVKNGIVDNMTLQKYLTATDLLKDSIQGRLNMIASDDGKLSDAAVRRQLDTKILSVMCKPIPIDAAFKDQANFDTHNLVISLLLTQIEIGKNQNEKEIKKQLATATSMKDLKIAKHLQQLSQFNRNRPLGSGDDDDDDGDDDNNDGRLPTLPLPPPPPPPPYNFCHRFLSSPLSDDDDEDDDDTPLLPPPSALAQKVMLSVDGSTAAAAASVEKPAVKKKVVLSKNLNHTIPEAQEVLERPENDAAEITQQ